jgi:probable blue pigment (indigoidine) exporter
MKNIIIGLVFASLWASASVATKYSLLSCPSPLIISNIRFFIAGILMLLGAHLGYQYPLPKRSDWQPFVIYGLLNVTIYLGAFVMAMKEVSAGVGTLAVGTNPLIISLLSAIFYQKKIERNIVVGLLLGIIGVGIATYTPLLEATVTMRGILILMGSMLSYSLGTIYFSSREWTQPRLVINGWQVFLGGVFLLPLTFLFSDFKTVNPDFHFWGGVCWLAIPVSIGAVQLWLYLLSKDPVRASLWLFLCPVFGFYYAHLFLNEKIDIYTYIGTFFVIFGLYIGQKKP